MASQLLCPCYERRENGEEKRRKSYYEVSGARAATRLQAIEVNVAQMTDDDEQLGLEIFYQHVQNQSQDIYHSPYAVFLKLEVTVR